VLALGQDVDLSLLDGVDGLVIQDGVVQVDERLMTGAPASSPAATWCRPSATSPWRWATARRRRGTSTPGCGAQRRGARTKHDAAGFERLNPGTTATRRPPSARARPARRQTTFDEVQGGLTRAMPCSRRALPVLRQLLRVRQLLRRLP
jgi:hypothetical protein